MGEYNEELLLGKYPYARDGDSSKYVIIFPPTSDLIQSVATSRDSLIKSYRKFFPSNDYSLLILGYDRNLSSDHSSEGIAADFAQIINETNSFKPKIEVPAVIVGVSYGGKIAIPFAERYPEMVSKLFLIVSAHELSEKGMVFCRECIDLARAGKKLELVLKFNELFKLQVTQYIANLWVRMNWWRNKEKLNKPDTLVNAFEYILNHNQDTKKYLQKIKADTLVLGAEMDLLFSEDVYRETAALIPKGIAKIIKGTGHMAPVEKETTCRREVLDFLSS